LRSGALTIGRGTGCNIVLLSAAVSRLHGRLALTSNGLYYNDEGSANGSFIDGKQIKGPVPVGPRQVLELGEFKVSVEQGVASAVAVSPPRAPVPAAAAPAAAVPAAAAPVAPAPPAPKAGEIPPPTLEDLELIAVPSAQGKPKASTVRGNDLTESALPGFNFKIPEAQPPKQSAAEAMLANSATQMLDAQIKGIQQRRVSAEDTVRIKRETFEKEWRDAMNSTRDLQGKLKQNPRVLYFVISRDGDEASVKVADGSRRGWANLTLSRKHPVNNKVQDDVVWYAEYGEDPRAYHSPKEALDDFVRNIASKLA
jgi:hypothetical protein